MGFKRRLDGECGAPFLHVGVFSVEVVSKTRFHVSLENRLDYFVERTTSNAV